MTQYYITRPDGRQEGPYDEVALLSRVAAGKYDADVTVWFEGLAEWEPIGRHFPLPAATSAPPTAVAPLPPVAATLPSAADDYTTDAPGSALPEAEEYAPPAEAAPIVRRSKRMSQGQWVTIFCIVAVLLLLAAGGGYFLGKNNPPAMPASSPAATAPAEEEDAALPTEDDAPLPAEEEEPQPAEDIPTPENTADAPAPAAEDEPAPQSSTPEDTADNPFVDDAFTDDTAEPDTPEQDTIPAAEDAEDPSTPDTADTAVQSAESPTPADDTTAAKDTADNEDENADTEEEEDTPAAANDDEDDAEEADEADADAAPKELSADEKKEVDLLKKRISNHYKRKANCYKQIALMKHKIKLHNMCRSCASGHCDSQGITGACRHWYMAPFDGKRIKVTHQLPQGAKRYSGIDQAVSSLELNIERIQKGIAEADAKIQTDSAKLTEFGCSADIPEEPSYEHQRAAERSSYSGSSYSSYDSDFSSSSSSRRKLY